MTADYSEAEIRLVDLVADRVDLPVIASRVFQNCRIVGPAVVSFSEHAKLRDCTFDAVDGDAESLLFERPEGSPMVGVVRLQDCEFYGCEFVAIGIAGTPSTLRQFRELVS